MRACDYILSCQAINVAASQDPGTSRAYPILKTPGQSDWMPEPIPGIVLFRLVATPLESDVVGPYMVWGVWFSSRLLFPRSYAQFWVVTGAGGRSLSPDR
jgi:hypothetical protein